MDVALGTDSSVYVADTDNNRIKRYNPSGVLLGMWGSPGTGPGQFNSPQSLAVASDGSVYVADTFNDRIQRFSPTGAFLGQWGTWGGGEGQFSHPSGISVGLDGRVYVSDTENNRIEVFGAEFSAAWRGEYYANRWLTGAPVLVQDSATLDFEWQDSAPGPGVPVDNFSTRFRRIAWFDAGTYRFTVFADEGVRLWVDDQMLLEEWRDGRRASFR